MTVSRKLPSMTLNPCSIGNSWGPLKKYLTTSSRYFQMQSSQLRLQLKLQQIQSKTSNTVVINKALMVPKKATIPHREARDLKLTLKPCLQSRTVKELQVPMQIKVSQPTPHCQSRSSSGFRKWPYRDLIIAPRKVRQIGSSNVMTSKHCSKTQWPSKKSIMTRP